MKSKIYLFVDGSNLYGGQFRLKETKSALTFTRKQKITVVDFRKENIIMKV